jgi:hypothetical protein
VLWEISTADLRCGLLLVTAASFSLLASLPFPITRFDGAATGADRTYGYAEETRSNTLEAERQVRDFLIGPRNTKHRKKRSTITILHPPFQITSRDF